MEQLRKDGDELTKAGKEPTSEMVEGIFSLIFRYSEIFEWLEHLHLQLIY